MNTYQFQKFDIDAENMEMYCDGQPIKISRLPLAILIYLIENRQRVVPREELLQKFWSIAPDDAQDRLNTAIQRARTALNHSADGEVYIQTKPCVGYRFVYPLHMTERKWTRSFQSLQCLISSSTRTLSTISVVATIIVMTIAYLSTTTSSAQSGATLAISDVKALCSESKRDLFGDGLKNAFVDQLVNGTLTAIPISQSRLLISGDQHETAVYDLNTSVRYIAGAALVHTDLVSRENGIVVWTAEFREKVNIRDFSITQRAISTRLIEALRQDAGSSPDTSHPLRSIAVAVSNSDF